MITVKNLFDAIEEEDGQRLWIEPDNLTRDLREWCGVNHVLCHLAPSAQLAEWFERHPEGYEYFRATYHEALLKSKYLPILRQIAVAAQHENFTFLHQSEDPAHNAGTALHEFISELQAYCPPEGT